MIGVTGASGYVGGVIYREIGSRKLGRAALIRRPPGPVPDARPFVLGEPLDERVLEDVDCVVHAAWDLQARGAAAWAVNVEGSRALAEACRSRSIPIIFVSSLSAYRGCVSTYGRTKLAVEDLVVATGGSVIRPGLVFGNPPAGLFGELVTQVRRAPLIPLVGAGRPLYLSHDLSLAALVADLASGTEATGARIFAAYETPSSLAEVTGLVARAVRSRSLRVPVPPRLAYGALRALEAVRLPVRYRSDSVIALIHPCPLDQLAELAAPSVDFPRFSGELVIGTRP